MVRDSIFSLLSYLATLFNLPLENEETSCDFYKGVEIELKRFPALLKSLLCAYEDIHNITYQKQK